MASVVMILAPMDTVDVLQVSLRVLFAVEADCAPDPVDVAVMRHAHPKLAGFEDAGELAAQVTQAEIKRRKWRWGDGPFNGTAGWPMLR
jgi:hypothetical protein